MARRSGVSISTVSRVLNNSKPVSPEIRQKVLEAIKETGYRPNLLARGLVLRKTNIIGIIVPDISNSYYSELVKGTEEISNMYNYSILLCNTYGELKKEMEYLNLLLEKQVDGIIFMTTNLTDDHINWFKENEVKAVFVNRRAEGLDIPYVSIDNYNAAYDATNYLIKLGHKKIAYVGGPLSDEVLGKERFEGYKQAIYDAGIDFKQELVRVSKIGIRNGYEAMADILDVYNDITAVFAANDIMAIGAVNCILDRGYKIPDDISVVGFDDIPLASIIRPALTTIRQPIYDIGAVAARMLIKKLNGEKLEEKAVNLPYQLIERDTSAKAR
ncbi:transcriptional regulator, LacI family [Caldanaerobius fijiensis DSM 17918]|uniref:Transcriptional regulator, LacI family n=1 Tax=Caldanaerobius fijiensis DSM 17918 TaxID=1121256 RepID=A0A1M4WME6_9THEO|nr:LacI family DNA-binding transcriptional regulator [Caldanaerobius fijiensis]SHE82142.1 transcriptional regulator, LacI family [Caldanaerobius fijiensis DSM 17918]